MLIINKSAKYPHICFSMRLRKNFIIWFIGLLLIGSSCQSIIKKNAKAKRISFKGNNYDIFMSDYPKDKIKFYWKDKSGNKLRSIANLNNYVAEEGHTLKFATNAGMYMENNSPLGLYIENKKERAPLNLSLNGKGNFYKQPNGIFFLSDSTAKIITTEKYNPSRDRPIYATQSGPMLVIDGMVNPVFTKGSSNINIRSGVGITIDGRVAFAISNELVNFYDFAILFKESLHCNNALFLDGAISKMYLPELNRNDFGGDFGVMIGIEK